MRSQTAIRAFFQISIVFVRGVMKTYDKKTKF